MWVRRLLISDFATGPNVPLWMKTITNGLRLFWLDTEFTADKVHWKTHKSHTQIHKRTHRNSNKKQYCVANHSENI